MSEQLPPGGIYYEPRSYWSLLSSTDGGLWNQDHFRNDGRYPITFTRFTISSVNQVYDWFNPSQIFTNIHPFTFPNLLQKTLQQIRVPFRQNYTRTATTTGTFRPRPAAEVESKRWSEPAINIYPLQGWGPRLQQSRLNFCHPLYLPQFGSIEFGLSALDDWGQFAQGNVLLDADIDEIKASVAWFEEGGLFAGSARIKNVPVPVRSTPEDFAYTSSEGWPYPLPVGEAGQPQAVNYPAINNGVPWWPPASNFTPTEFDRQEATRTGSTKILGLSVSFDALAYLRRIFEIQEDGAGNPDPGTSVPAPLSQRIGCSVRTTNGGSGDYWWRPGAPLSLVLDSITPSMVYDLDAPITLSPGDSLILDEIAESFAAPDAPVDVKNLCIAFNGFAAIEG